jgi:hypothetical protein
MARRDLIRSFVKVWSNFQDKSVLDPVIAYGHYLGNITSLMGVVTVTEDEKLAHSLKLKFGLAPYEPTAVQLARIKVAIQRIRDRGRSPTHADWGSAVRENCPSAGSFGYSGVDNSDLNTLLAIALQNSKKKS